MLLVAEGIIKFTKMFNKQINFANDKVSILQKSVEIYEELQAHILCGPSDSLISFNLKP